MSEEGQTILAWGIAIFSVLLPIANYVSFSRALRRTAERMRQRRMARGLPAEPDTRRRWKNYSRGTDWDRYAR